MAKRKKRVAQRESVAGSPLGKYMPSMPTDETETDIEAQLKAMEDMRLELLKQKEELEKLSEEMRIYCYSSDVKIERIQSRSFLDILKAHIDQRKKLRRIVD